MGICSDCPAYAGGSVREAFHFPWERKNYHGDNSNFPRDNFSFPRDNFSRLADGVPCVWLSDHFPPCFCRVARWVISVSFEFIRFQPFVRRLDDVGGAGAWWCGKKVMGKTDGFHSRMSENVAADARLRAWGCFKSKNNDFFRMRETQLLVFCLFPLFACIIVCGEAPIPRFPQFLARIVLVVPFFCFIVSNRLFPLAG